MADDAATGGSAERLGVTVTAQVRTRGKDVVHAVATFALLHG